MAVYQLDEASKLSVFSLIANITGHQIEDLDTDMYLEGDLGLDSIKMITLMNELMKLIPSEQISDFTVAHPVESLLALQKVGDIVEMIDQWQEGLDEPEKLEIINAQYPFFISYFAVSTLTICTGVKLRGELDQQLLWESWKELINRHPVLRSVFEVDKAAKSFKEFRLKMVKDVTPPQIKTLDLRQLNDETKQEKIKNKFESSVNQKFDIFQWPLHAVEVIRTGDWEYEIFLSINHTISDGLGNQQIIKELLEIYGSKMKGLPHHLPRAITTSEYNDMATKLNEWNDPDEKQTLEAFLKQQGREKYFFNPYKGINKTINEPFVGVSIKSQKFWIDKETTELLISRTKSLGVSLFVLLVSAYLKTVRQFGESKNNIILNLPTGGKVYPNVDATGILGPCAQNLALTFHFDQENEGWESFVKSVDKEIKSKITSGIDRAQTYKAAYEAKEHITLENGVLPKSIAGFIRSTLKSNLYLSFVGNTNIKERYGDLEVSDYEAYTCTNPGAIDNLVELFQGKILITSNYDSTYFEESFINQYMNRFIYYLKELAAYSFESHAISTQRDKVVKRNPEIESKLCAVVAEVCGKNVQLEDMEKDLDAVFGMDSLQRIRVITRLENVIGKCNREELFGCRTLNEMVAVISDKDTIPYLRIIEQCKKTPDAIAIEFGNEKITYHELNDVSNRMANYLISIGVKQGSLVGIMTCPGPLMLFGIMAILKSGAAYVPVDPAYPAERINYILNHSKIDTLLSEHALIEQIAHLQKNNLSVRTLIHLDYGPADPSISLSQVERGEWMEYASMEPKAISLEEDVMTVLYTSGSTGNPKGVMLSHCGYMNRLLWHQKMFQLRPGERVAQKTSCCFDISIWELFWPLMYGGTVCPITMDVVKNPWKLGKWLMDTKINIMHFVPSLFGEFVHAIEGENYHFNDLRWLLFSGEVLPMPIIQRWIDAYGMKTGLANLYGPTEASIDVTYHRIDKRPGAHGETSIPIGKAIDNVFIKILDDHMREIPVGELGELWIGGIQLARGYLNNPEKTMESFKPNPFSEIPGEFLYRTGDLVIERGDGSYEYHGRIDHQVKVRGFRIELGEVESILSSHPDVREAAVIASNFSEGQKQLVACLSGKQIDERVLKNFLGQKLPHYMIPSRIEWLPNLPKNPNGKLDRKAISKLLQSGMSIESEEIIPVGPAQRWLMNYFEHPYRWTGYTRFLYKQPLDLPSFNKALSLLIDRHDALRSVLLRKGNHWVQQILPQGVSTNVEFYNGSEMNEEARNEKVRKLIDEAIQGFKVDQWPLLKVIILKVTDSLFDIAVVGHHLISDVITNQLLFKEIWKIYGQLIGDTGEINLPPVKSYKDFVLLVEEKKKEHLDEYVGYWQKQFPMDASSFHVPYDFQLGANDEESARLEHFTVDKQQTSLLLGRAKSYFQSNVYPIILAPLYKMLGHLYDQVKVIVSHRGHGRDLGDQHTFFQTAGNFATNYPLGISMDKQDEWMDVVQKIKTGLNEIPMNGISYDLVSSYLPTYMYPDLKLTSIRANYLGNRDLPKLQTFEFREEDMDRRLSMPQQKRISGIEFFFSIMDGQLHLDIEFSKNLYEAATIKHLGEQYIHHLQSMISSIEEREPTHREKVLVSASSRRKGLLEDKVALITGGGRGIGRSIALSLAKEGVKIAILSRTEHQLEDTATEIRKMGGQPLVCPVDIRDFEEVENVVKTVNDHFGKLDIIVNNAGITKMGGILDVDREEWERILQVNLFGTYHVCRAAIPYLVKQKQGKIVNIGSDSSFIGYPLMSAYAASKHGVLGLTKSLSEELKPYNIQVNTVCPALVNTDMAPDAFRKKAIPPESVADIVTFLASATSDYITGEAIKIYGKQDMYWYGSEQMPMIKAMLGIKGNE